MLRHRFPQILKNIRYVSISRLKYCTNESKNDENEQKAKDSFDKTVMVRGQFEHINQKDRTTYMEMIKVFEGRDVHRRNHVEFIYAAMKNMENFGVQKDLQVYKALINVMPKGKFVPTNMLQSEFQHYPKQQQCIIDLLEQMEDNGVIPDYEMEDMLLNVFGRRGHPVRKYWRMMYWMPKFKNLSPWALPNPVPNETLELAKLAVERMCTVDLQSKVEIFDTKDVPDAVDETWIVSGQSPVQAELLSKHDNKKALYIEGPSLIWLRNKSINYYMLRSEPPPPLKEKVDEEGDDTDDVSKLNIPFLGIGLGHTSKTKNKLSVKKTIHEQDDGTIFAICVTGSSTKDSLLSWIRLLGQHGNPHLKNIPIVFKFYTPPPENLPSVFPSESAPAAQTSSS